MSDLTGIEKMKLEGTLDMGGGYVLGFSNRTFGEFFVDFFGIDIWDPKYNYASGSKANRMRAFWRLEGNYLVGRVLATIFENWSELAGHLASEEPPEECLRIAQRLMESSPTPDLAGVVPAGEDRSFDSLARAVGDAIARNEPEAGLDRLHTFVVKYFRSICQKRGVGTPRDKPLHSLVGEYAKVLRSSNEIESQMTERILKSSIAIMDAFNDVRNNRSLAHDKEMLSRDEALLIFNHVTCLVRFVQSIEARGAAAPVTVADQDEDMPF
ncbi:MAG: abortive infection family protein [Thermoleophilia bacterium]